MKPAPEISEEDLKALKVQAGDIARIARNLKNLSEDLLFEDLEGDRVVPINQSDANIIDGYISMIQTTIHALDTRFDRK